MFLNPTERIAVFVFLVLIGAILGFSYLKGTISQEQTPEIFTKGKQVFLVDLNSAKEEQLVLLPGIGPKRAGQIIKYRKKPGRFKNLDDPRKIPGITSQVIQKLKPYLKNPRPKNVGVRFIEPANEGRMNPTPTKVKR